MNRGAGQRLEYAQLVNEELPYRSRFNEEGSGALSQ